ncbi:hypothetical protein Bbelb_120700 [Branchiostoma belcheri]|nr:hypothetical protein Bbelb_120700 [Branchiostoma belcheri]
MAASVGYGKECGYAKWRRSCSNSQCQRCRVTSRDRGESPYVTADDLEGSMTAMKPGSQTTVRSPVSLRRWERFPPAYSLTGAQAASALSPAGRKAPSEAPRRVYAVAKPAEQGCIPQTLVRHDALYRDRFVRFIQPAKGAWWRLEREKNKNADPGFGEFTAPGNGFHGNGSFVGRLRTTNPVPSLSPTAGGQKHSRRREKNTPENTQFVLPVKWRSWQLRKKVHGVWRGEFTGRKNKEKCPGRTDLARTQPGELGEGFVQYVRVCQVKMADSGSGGLSG